MSAQMLIDQAGLPAGTPGVARTDGLDTGALVTLESTGSGSTHEFRLLWTPTNDVTAVASLAPSSPTIWTFSPTALAYGTYRIELIVDEGLSTESRQVRAFVVRTPNAGLIIPALNEVASPTASLENAGGDQIDASENNEPFGPFISGSYAGWWRAFEEWVLHIDGLSVVRAAPAVVVGNALSGDTAADCDYLDTGNGAQLEAAIVAANAANKDVWIRPGLYDFNLVGGPSAPITVSVKVRGAGNGQTAIGTRDNGDQGVFELSNGQIEDVIVLVRKPLAATAGSTAVVSLVGGSMRRVRVEFDAWDAAGASDTTLRSGVTVTTGDGVVLEDIVVYGMPSMIGYGETGESAAFRLSAGGGVEAPVRLSRCSSVNSGIGDVDTDGAADYGFWITGSQIQLSHCDAQNARIAGYFVNEGSRQLLDCCHWELSSNMVATGMVGIDVNPEDEDTIEGVRILGCTLEGASLGSEIGIRLDATTANDVVDRCVLSNNYIDGCDIGIELTADAAASLDKTVLLGNQLSNCSTPISQLNDTNTDAAHNQS